MWGAPQSFPRAILHVDGDSFFASCEVAKNPALRGKPVITGKERGIVSACTYEAKRAGVKRGMRLLEARAVCPSAVILPSDYETYSLFSKRMYDVVRRYTPAVEEYSIDECFADLTPSLKNGIASHGRKRYPEVFRKLHTGEVPPAMATQEADAILSAGQAGKLAVCIKRDLECELGMTFSLGLAATKTLAKVGSKWQKPAGLTVIPLDRVASYLAELPCIKIWGIGHATAAYLEKYGVQRALQFARKDESWVREHLTKPGVATWKELNGEVANKLDTAGRKTYQSISKTKTFTPPSCDKGFVFSQLSKNIENACIKARRWGLVTPRMFFFLKTQAFHYHGCEVRLAHPTAIPQEVVRAASEHFDGVFRQGVPYRATGITLLKLQDAGSAQLDLFGGVGKTQNLAAVFESVDTLSERFGKHVVFLGSSFNAVKFGAHLGARGDIPLRAKQLFKGETARRRLSLPYLGDVS